LDIGEPLNSQEFLRDVLRRHTDARYADQSDPLRLGRRLGGGDIGLQSEQSCASCETKVSKKLSSAPVIIASFTHVDLL
jgi:hypothetical protein